jgi:hypothetical protein
MMLNDANALNHKLGLLQGRSAAPTFPSWKSQPEHSSSADPPGGPSQHPPQRQGTSLRNKEDVRNRDICRHEYYVRKDCGMSDMMCQATSERI